MAALNRIVSITEAPNLPGYGIPQWEDGTTSHPAPMSFLNKALEAQTREAEERQRGQRVAQNDVRQGTTDLLDQRQMPTQAPAPNQEVSADYWGPTNMSMERPAATPVNSDVQQPGMGPDQQPPGRILDPHQLAVAEYAMTPVRMPGRAAYDPEKDAAARRAVPEQRTTEIQAQPFDAEAEQRLQETQRATAQVQADADLEGAQGTLLQRRIQLQNQQELEAMQQKRVADAQSFYNSETARLKQQGQELAAKKVDPDRYWSGQSTWAKLGWVIGAALLGGAGSDAGLQLIQRRMENDVELQLNELRDAKNTHENELSRLMQRWGSLEAAKDALFVQHAQSIAAQAEVTAANIGTDQAATNARLVRAKLEEAIAGRMANLQNASLGQVVTREVAAMRAPQAASGGGLRYRTPEEIQRFRKVEADIAASEAQTGKVGMETVSIAQQMRQEANGGMPSKQVEIRKNEFGKAMETVEERRSSLARRVQLAGGELKNDGSIVWKTDSIPGVGTWQNMVGMAAESAGRNPEAYQQFLSSDAGAELRRLNQEAFISYRSEKTGAAFGQRESQDMAQSQAQSFLQGEREMRQNMQKEAKLIYNKTADLAGAAGPEAVKAWERDRAQYIQDQRSQAEGVIGRAQPQ